MPRRSTGVVFPHGANTRACPPKKILAADSDGVAECEGGPRRFETLLQFKGFAGGVPQNTERTTVKPWVGIAR